MYSLSRHVVVVAVFSALAVTVGATPAMAQPVDVCDVEYTVEYTVSTVSNLSPEELAGVFALMDPPLC